MHTARGSQILPKNNEKKPKFNTINAKIMVSARATASGQRILLQLMHL